MSPPVPPSPSASPWAHPAAPTPPISQPQAVGYGIFPPRFLLGDGWQGVTRSCATSLSPLRSGATMELGNISQPAYGPGLEEPSSSMLGLVRMLHGFLRLVQPHGLPLGACRGSQGHPSRLWWGQEGLTLCHVAQRQPVMGP